jgi:hypothetical protein
MADSIYTFDPTAASNTALDSIAYGPNQLYHSNIDNLFRAFAAKLAQVVDDLGAVNTVGGTGDAITVTLASGITAYATGQFFRFVAGAANTGATTINVNSIGVKKVRKISGGSDVALAAGDIAAGETYLVVYRASADSAAGAFVIVGAAAVAAATTSAAGIVELATLAETLAGTDAVRAVTPSTLYFPTGHLYGLTLSNNGSDATNDIDIAAGTARDSTDSYNIILASALTKQLDAAWAVGTNQGMLATGVAVTDTTYYIFVIKRSDTGVVDVAADTSSTGANIATNTNAAYTIVRQIGYVIRAGGVNGVPTWTDAGRVQTGTFTPTPTFGGGSTGMTFSNRRGKYAKRGSLVSFELQVGLSAKGSSAGGVAFGGLPFAALTSASCYPGFLSGMASLSTGLFGLISASGTSIVLYTNSATGGAQMTEANFTDTSIVLLNGFYFV